MFGNYKFTELLAMATTAVAFSFAASTLVGVGLAAALPATAAVATGIGFASTIAGVMGFMVGFPAGMKLHGKISDMHFGMTHKRKHQALNRPGLSVDKQGVFSKMGQSLSNIFKSSKNKQSITVVGQNPNKKNDNKNKNKGPQQ